MTYDFTDASDFLCYEVQTTPEELYEEICRAMRKLSPRGVTYHTLLTLADFFERVTPKAIPADP